MSVYLNGWSGLIPAVFHKRMGATYPDYQKEGLEGFEKYFDLIVRRGKGHILVLKELQKRTNGKSKAIAADAALGLVFSVFLGWAKGFGVSPKIGVNGAVSSLWLGNINADISRRISTNEIANLVRQFAVYLPFNALVTIVGAKDSITGEPILSQDIAWGTMAAGLLAIWAASRVYLPSEDNHSNTKSGISSSSTSNSTSNSDSRASRLRSFVNQAKIRAMQRAQRVFSK